MWGTIWYLGFPMFAVSVFGAPHKKYELDNDSQYNANQFDVIYDQRQKGRENYKFNVDGLSLVWSSNSLLAAAALLEPALYGEYPETNIDIILGPEGSTPEEKPNAKPESEQAKPSGEKPDYEYNYDYDYTDFTIKPSGSTSTTTTPKPTSSNPPPSTTKKEPPSSSIMPPSSSSESIMVPSDLLLPSQTQSSTSTEQPSNVDTNNAHPYPIEVIVPQQTKNPKKEESENPITDSSQSNTANPENKNKENLPLEIIQNEITSSSPTASPQTSPNSSSKPSNTSSPLPESFSSTPDASPGKIKVKILDIPSAGIVPGEDVQGISSSASVLQGEITSYRKCSTGFARDKKGRCRRMRRPGVTSPFGFSRLASNLATRLRLKTHEDPAETSIPTEE